MIFAKASCDFKKLSSFRTLTFFIWAFCPEIRQYLIESDTEKLPFSRNRLSVSTGKGRFRQTPLGTIQDVYQTGTEWLAHTASPSQHISHESLRTIVGGKECLQPYAISVFNVSAMSFGALSANAIMALNRAIRNWTKEHAQKTITYCSPKTPKPRHSYFD
jgi:glutamate synthase domain-containing protein 2